MLATHESSILSKPGTLCYCSTKCLLMLLGGGKSHSLKSSVMIVDEFDAFIFERDPNVELKV